MNSFKKLINVNVLIFIILLLTGCARKNLTHSKSAYILVKTPNLKFADAGFVRFTKDSVILELYVASKPIVTLEISPSSVCQGTLKCLDAKEFNDKYLHPSYPSDSLYKIVTGSTLPKELQRTDISYNLDNQTIRFHDRKNNILIKIRKLQE